jgi:hypothetical protein
MTFRASVEKYLKAIAAQERSGDAREESYYDALKVLFVDLGPQVSNAHTRLTVLPSQTEAGNPDMRVWSGDQHITGYVECKEPNVANLDRVEVSEQSIKFVMVPQDVETSLSVRRAGSGKLVRNVRHIRLSTSSLVTCTMTKRV